MIKNSGNPTAIFFDVDGVLLDSMELKASCFVDALAAYCDDPESIKNFHYEHAGLNSSVKLRKMWSELLGNPVDEAKVREIEFDFAHRLSERLNEIRVYPDTHYALEFWSRRCLIFAVSAMPHQELETLLLTSRIAPYFEAYLGYPPSKEATLRRELSARHLQPQSCVLVGDSDADRDAAESVGLMFIRVIRDGSRSSIVEQEPKNITVANLHDMQDAVDMVLAKRVTFAKGSPG